MSAQEEAANVRQGPLKRKQGGGWSIDLSKQRHMDTRPRDYVSAASAMHTRPPLLVLLDHSVLAPADGPFAASLPDALAATFKIETGDPGRQSELRCTV
eukprot:2423080-Prymnesium_polylepis.1